MFSLQPSPEDARDWHITAASPEVPETLDYRSSLMPIRQQGQQGTCAAQTAACMKEYQERLEHGFMSYMSPQFIYNHRSYWNNDNQDGEDELEDYGMTCRDIMKILHKIGVCPEEIYPYGKIQYAKEIPEKIKQTAVKNCIQGYARIHTQHQLKSSLVKNGPCMIAFPVYHMGENMWQKRNSNDELLGGHAMTIVGYDEDGFMIRNSWGNTWGRDGYCLYPYKDWGAHWEIWTTVDKQSPPPTPPTPPTPLTPSRRSLTTKNPADADSTHMVGKWHVGLSHPKETPHGRGFATSKGCLTAAEAHGPPAPWTAMSEASASTPPAPPPGPPAAAGPPPEPVSPASHRASARVRYPWAPLGPAKFDKNCEIQVNVV